MDRRRNYFMVLDTETTNTLIDPLVYDIGFIIADRQGNIYKRGSYIVSDLFNKSEYMESAYYAAKIPEYKIDIEKGNREVKTFFEIKMIVRDLVKKYHITDIYAYNAGYDRKALNKTERYLTKSKFRYFLPYGVNYYCIWNMACTTLFQQKRFRKVAKENCWYSDKGQTKTTAEIAYKYMTGNYSFSEEHKGLEDVMIEYDIMLKCLAQHKVMDKSIDTLCWKKVK